MTRKRTKNPPVVYTNDERRRFLFRTAAEMRLINDKADKRSKNRAFREDQEFNSETKET